MSHINQMEELLHATKAALEAMRQTGPKRIRSLRSVVDSLMDDIDALHEQGFTFDEIAAQFAQGGIHISGNTLRTYRQRFNQDAKRQQRDKRVTKRDKGATRRSVGQTGPQTQRDETDVAAADAENDASGHGNATPAEMVVKTDVRKAARLTNESRNESNGLRELKEPDDRGAVRGAGKKEGGSSSARGVTSPEMVVEKAGCERGSGGAIAQAVANAKRQAEAVSPLASRGSFVVREDTPDI